MVDFSGKRVLVLGLARSGMAAVKLLHKLGAVVTVSEQKATGSRLRSAVLYGS